MYCSISTLDIYSLLHCIMSTRRHSFLTLFLFHDWLFKRNFFHFLGYDIIHSFNPVVEKNIVHVGLSETVNKRRNNEKHFLASSQKVLCCGVEDFIMSDLDSVVVEDDHNLFIQNWRFELEEVVFSWNKANVSVELIWRGSLILPSVATRWLSGKTWCTERAVSTPSQTKL